MRGEVKFWRNLEGKGLKFYIEALLPNFVFKMRYTLQIDENC